MRSLRLDFLHPAPRPGWPAWLLLAVGLALAAWVAWHDSRLDATLAAEVAEQRRLSLPSKAGRVAAGRGQTDAQRASELLALPWNELFARLEKLKTKDIALISLEADGHRTEATLTAEAKNFNAMLAYIEALKSEGGFKSVTLTSHLLREEDPQQPYRFVLRLGWRS